MADNIYREFGTRLSKLRIEKGISQNDIAKKLGIAQTTYSGYENGVRKIPLEFITKLSNMLEVSPTYLITGENPKNDKVISKAMSETEQEYIKKYRSLNENGKNKVNDYMDFVLSQPENVKYVPDFNAIKNYAEELADELAPLAQNHQKYNK